MTDAEKTAKKQRIIGKPFVKGQSGNPNGRPKGSGISITTAIKNELNKVPAGQDKATYLDLLVKRIMKKAIQEGDQQTIKQIWNYVDGMPRQEGKMELDIPSGLLVKIIDGKRNSNNGDTD